MRKLICMEGLRDPLRNGRNMIIIEKASACVHPARRWRYSQDSGDCLMCTEPQEGRESSTAGGGFRRLEGVRGMGMLVSANDNSQKKISSKWGETPSLASIEPKNRWWSGPVTAHSRNEATHRRPIYQNIAGGSSVKAPYLDSKEYLIKRNLNYSWTLGIKRILCPNVGNGGVFPLIL